MFRAVLILGLFLAVCGERRAAGQEHDHDHGNDLGSNPLACAPSTGETCYHAVIDDFQSHHSPHPNALGEAFFALRADRTELRYRLTLDGLNLKPNAADRTEPDDIIGVHLHLYVPDAVGPHVLNIFGLATYNMPAEEDADLVVDYTQRALSGIYDNGDATIDPATGQPYPPFLPLTSKPLSDWLERLEQGELMVAVHTNASGFPTMAIHGHISRVVPEPATIAMLAGGSLIWLVYTRRRFTVR